MPVGRLRPLLLGAVLLGVAAAAVAGCGGAGPPAAPTVAPARTFELVGFSPARPVAAGRPARVAFRIRQPDGTTLTTFARGNGPHTGVHLIIVRDDLAYIIHQHPPVGPNGLLRQTVTFPAPGRYRGAPSNSACSREYPPSGAGCRPRG